MIPPAIEKQTAQFYEWELLGRGWLLGDEAVDLEPPFTPFFGHYLRSATFSDDGMRHTLLSRLAAFFKNKQPQKEKPSYPEVSYVPFPSEDHIGLTTLRLMLPKNYKADRYKTEQLLLMLSCCTMPVSFEIIGTHKEITLQFVCRYNYVHFIQSQLKTLFHDVSILVDITDYDEIVNKELSFATVDFGLKEEFMRPLAQSKAAAIDPFTGIFSIMEHLEENERTVIQVLFNGVINHWESSIIRAVTNSQGEAFFANAPEMLPMAKEKVSSPFFATTIRLLTHADTPDDALILLNKLSFALTANTRSSGNSLTWLADESYTAQKRLNDILFRKSHRVGMLLNSHELASFVHLPDASLISKKMLGETRKTKPAPKITEGHTLKLGQNIHQGIEKEVTIADEQRLKHTHIIGATGTGKSTLLLSMICHDIEKGEGVAVLDPHGDLINSIISKIPHVRLKDVILIDPSDSDFPIGFNILKAHSDIEKEVLSSDLVAAFKRLSTSWGDQMNSVFANAILAFLESNRGGTLADVRRFLIEKSFREEFLKTVLDPNIIYYWKKEYPLIKTNSIGPILTRLDSFLRHRLIRNMVAQPKGIDFEEILNTRKILLVKLAQGLIGTENSFLLGTFVVSKIHQVALARQAQEKRNNSYFYIDEFQHFITPSMSHILSGARKYHLGLILAHQDLQQLQKNDNDLLNTLIANAGTRICFRLGDTDARKLSDGFSSFEASDFQNLNTGEAITRIERPEFDFSLSTFPYDITDKAYVQKQEVINLSRQKYGTPRQDVETMLKESMVDFEPKEIKETPIKERVGEKIIQPAPLSQQIPASIPAPPKQADKSDKELTDIIRKKEKTQHRYLQSLIKKIAESKGYKATLEMRTPDAKGSIDVSIEGYDQKIACEVSVTTDSNWELHNIAKCLNAGYDVVFVCCTDKKSIEDLSQKVKKEFDESINNRVFVSEPEGLFNFLDNQVIHREASETKFKGYRVKVEYDAISHEEQQRKRESVSKIVLESLRKMKK